MTIQMTCTRIGVEGRGDFIQTPRSLGDAYDVNVNHVLPDPGQTFVAGQVYQMDVAFALPTAPAPSPEPTG